MDQTDVDSYFNHKFLDISQSHQRIVWISKGSRKSLLHSKCFNFAIQSYSSNSFWRKKLAFPKKKLRLYSTVWVKFPKLLIKPTKCRRFYYPNLLWDWIYRSKRRTVQSLLHGYSCAFEQTNLTIVLVWKEQDLRAFRRKVWTLRWSYHFYRNC